MLMRNDKGLGKILVDKSGEKHGTFTIVQPVSRANDGHLKWLIKCECGYITIVSSNNLRSATKHCPSCEPFIDRESKRLDEEYSGKKYNMVTILRFAYIKNAHRQYECRCDCGKVFYSAISPIKNGSRISCGCSVRTKERTIEPRINGKYRTSLKKKALPLYRVYNDMHRRCEKQYRKDYKRYGGRGICVCDEWSGEHGYDNFCDWAYKNGYDESAPYGDCTLDRIDVNGNYSPENCRWADKYVQANNRRNNHIVNVNGHKQTLISACREKGIDYRMVHSRLQRGWSERAAFVNKKGITRTEAEIIASSG